MLFAFWATAAVGVMDIWAIGHPDDVVRYKYYAMIFGGLMCPCWVVFSLVYARAFSWRDISAVQMVILGLSSVPVAVALAFPPSAFFYSPDFQMEQVVFLEPLAFFFYLQVMLFLGIALFNMEATVANALHGQKWKIKFAAVGAGTIIGAHLLFFSQSLLFRALDMGFVPVRFAATLLGVGLLAYSEFTRGVGERIVISRQLAYRSFVLFFCGVFLVVLGLVGEGVKVFGQDFNKYLFAIVGFSIIVGLVLVTLSENVRRKLRLSIQKHFYGEKYDYRIQWENFTKFMSEAATSDGIYRTILHAYCEVFGIVGGVLFLKARHDEEFYPVQFHEMDTMELSFWTDSPFVRKVMGAGKVLDVRNDVDSIDKDILLALRSRDVRFVLPVLSGEHLEGIILLGPPINPVENYDTEDFELMIALSRQVGVAIKNLRLGDELAQEREMENVGKMATFVLHDLKNQVYPLSLLLENSKEYINEPSFQKDMLESLSNITMRMKDLIKQLTSLPVRSQLKKGKVDLFDLAKETVGLLPDAKVTIRGGPVWIYGDKSELQKVVMNLYMNAMEAGHGKPFDVYVGDNGEPCLSVRDYGDGIDANVLREGLFLPFFTTKESGMGIGLYQSRQIVDAHEGRIDVANSPGEGATFSVYVPRY